MHRLQKTLPGLDMDLLRLVGASPLAQRLYLAGERALRQSSLDPRTRYRIMLAASELNESESSLRLVSIYAKACGMSELEIRDARHATSPSSRQRQLARFVGELLVGRGRVSEELVAEMERSGFARTALLEIIAIASFTSFGNSVVNALGSDTGQ